MHLAKYCLLAYVRLLQCYTGADPRFLKGVLGAIAAYKLYWLYALQLFTLWFKQNACSYTTYYE